MAVRSFLHVAIGHLTPAPSRDIHQGSVDAYPYATGWDWLLDIPAEEEGPTAALPADLQMIFTHARTQACSHVLIDCYGPVIDGLPVY